MRFLFDLRKYVGASIPSCHELVRGYSKGQRKHRSCSPPKVHKGLRWRNPAHDDIAMMMMSSWLLSPT